MAERKDLQLIKLWNKPKTRLPDNRALITANKQVGEGS